MVERARSTIEAARGERRRPTPLGALGRGVAAGLAGTAAVTAFMAAMSKLQGGGAQTEELEEDAGFESAPAPAQVGQRVVEGVFQRDVSTEQETLLENAVHWSYGLGWAGLYGIVQGTVRADPLRHGAVFGTIVWGASYLGLLPAARLSPPAWRLPAVANLTGLVTHLVYGLATAYAYELLDEQLD
jgi:hypothetical protein